MKIKAGKLVWQIYNGEVIQAKIKSAMRESDGAIYLKLTSPDGIGTTEWIRESVAREIVFDNYEDAKRKADITNKQIPRPFSVVDNATNEYPDVEKIALNEEWAKHLIYCDIDGFFVGEDGHLILVDDCGNAAWCPADRFSIVYE